MITKLQVLNLIEKNEVIEPIQLANYFGMRYQWAKQRINRLRRAGLIEPLSIERGRWILSLEGYRKADYLRRREDVKRRGEKARGSRG